MNVQALLRRAEERLGFVQDRLSPPQLFLTYTAWPPLLPAGGSVPLLTHDTPSNIEPTPPPASGDSARESRKAEHAAPIDPEIEVPYGADPRRGAVRWRHGPPPRFETMAQRLRAERVNAVDVLRALRK
jgi:hypothetical protein